MSNRAFIQKSERHPLGLWIIASSSALMSIGFGTINSLLILYATSIQHIPTSQAYLLSATYNSLLFTIPLIGGYLAEKLGFRRAFNFGILLLVIALCLISITNLQTMYFGLGMYTVGISLFVPTYLVLQGKLYAKDDKRRESAFTLSYIIMNAGFLIAGVTGGYLARYLGYSWTFRISALVTASIFLLYWFGKKYIKPYAKRSIEPQVKWHPTNVWLCLIGSSFLVILLAAWLLEHVKTSNEILFALITLVTLLILYVAIKRKNKAERRRLYALIILAYISVGFWALYTLEPSLLTIFIRDNVNRHLFTGIIPASTFYALDPFFIIILGGVFSYLWIYLSRINKNPTLPAKFTISLFTMGSGFLILILGIYFADQAGYSNMIWIVLCYFLLASAELFISPIGQSMVGRLSPEGMEGRLMGAWQLFTGFAGALSGYLAELAVVPKHSTIALTNPIYTQAFAKIGFMTIGLGVVSLALIPYVKKLISGKAK